MVELLDCKRSGATLAVDEGFTERLVAVESLLVGGEALANGGDMTSLFESKADEA